MERAVRSVLEQTYSPMEIVLSDQGSVDGTFEIISKLANEYTGPNTVRVLQCPLTENRGMAGLNDHLNWIHTQIDSDIIIMCSADDLNHPERAKYTVEAFKEHNPSYVGTCVQYMEADCVWKGEQTAYWKDGKPVEGDCFVDPVHNLNMLVGSSASSAWARDLWDKYAPLNGIESQDVLLPIFATLERGLYYVAKPLHAYIRHADVNNTGLEGVLRAAQTMEDKHAGVELVNFHVTSNYFAILRRLSGRELPADFYSALINKTLDSANMWALARDSVILNRVQPKMMRI